MIDPGQKYLKNLYRDTEIKKKRGFEILMIVKITTYLIQIGLHVIFFNVTNF